MKVKFLKLKDWLLISLMSVLGFSSCHCHKQLADPEEAPAPEVKDRGEIRLMYGVPTMNYMIRGQVHDTDGRPVKDIRVNMLERGMEVKDGELQGDPEHVKEWLEQSAVASDKEGQFLIKSSGTPQDQVRLLVRDVDGEKNGDFKNQLLEVEVQQGDIDREGAGGWNLGTFNKEVEINMENK